MVVQRTKRSGGDVPRTVTPSIVLLMLRAVKSVCDDDEGGSWRCFLFCGQLSHHALDSCMDFEFRQLSAYFCSPTLCGCIFPCHVFGGFFFVLGGLSQ